MRVHASWLAFTVLAACSDPSRSTAGDGESGSTAGPGDTTDSQSTAEPSSTGDRPTSGNSASMSGTDSSDPTTSSTGTTTDATTSPATTTSDTSDTTTDDTTTGGAVPGAFCGPIPACNAPPPKLPGQEAESSGYSRGRDMLYAEGEEQWILGKFTKWGFPIDKDIVGGTVHVFLDRGCTGDWIELGTAITTDDGDHPTIEGVDDSGGRVYFKIPAEETLELGRHRVHMIEDEQWETAELIIDVVPPGAPFFVSDVDGTLTTSENAEAWDFLIDNLPDANAFAAQALTLLAGKGYRPMYITARPEWLDRRTRQFILTRNFPRGIIHTTTTYTGATGDPAAAYKTAEFALLNQNGLVPSFVFGNKVTDSTAFENAGVQPLDHRIFFQYTDVDHGGRRIESYEELLGEFAALPDLCK
jgi:hypothetical protein